MKTQRLSAECWLCHHPKRRRGSLFIRPCSPLYRSPQQWYTSAHPPRWASSVHIYWGSGPRGSRPPAAAPRTTHI